MNRAAALVRRYPVVVWCVFALHAVFGLGYALLVPTYRGPDELAHVDMIRQYQQDPGMRDPSVQVPHLPSSLASNDLVGPEGRPRPPLTEVAPVPRPDRQAFDEMDTTGVAQRPNQMTQHPPGYYTIESVAARAVMGLSPQSLWSWDREVFFHRLTTWGWTIVLPLLAAEGALALGLARPYAGVAAAFTLCVPMATFIGSVANNDGLGFVLSGVAIVGAVAFLDRGGTRWAVVSALGCAGAPLTKSTAAPVAVFALLVVAVALQRSGGLLRRASFAPLAILGSGLAIGASWHLANLVRFAAPQPSGFTIIPRSPGEESLFSFTSTWLSRVSASFWGQPDRHTGVTLPTWSTTALTLALVAMVVIAVVSLRKRPWKTGLLVAFCLSQVLLMFRTNYAAHLRIGGFSGLQGRYLFPILVALAMVVALGTQTMLGRRPKSAMRAPWALVLVGSALHLTLGISMVNGYWEAGGDGISGRLGAVLAWSPLPRALSISVLGACVALSVAAIATSGFKMVCGDNTPEKIST